MKKSNKNFVLVLRLLFFSLLCSLNICTSAYAATTPDLGDAQSFGVLGGTYTNTAAGTTIDGDLGYTTLPAVNPTVTGSTESGTLLYSSAGVDQGAALAQLNSETPCTSLGTNVVLSGTYTPGCYTSSGSMSIVLGTTITLDGAGTYLFRPAGSFTTGANVIINTINGASACNVFWTPGGAATLGADNTFEGTIIDDSGITVGGATEWLGRALAFGGTVTTGTDVTITVPTCSNSAFLHIVKTVVNDSGGTAVASDFTINVTGTNVSLSSFAGSPAGVDISLDPGAYTVVEAVSTGYLASGSVDCSGTISAGETNTCTITNNDIAPRLIVNKIVVNDNGGTGVISDFALFIDAGSVTHGVTNTTTVGLHTVSETPNSGYTSVIGGDCAADGTVTLALGALSTCTITNNDIASTGGGGGGNGGGGGSSRIIDPPLINVLKVPSPLVLPLGPGPVLYTYTIENVGTVEVSDISMFDDKCSPVILIAGDTDNDSKLDVDEIWTYTCGTMLSETETNIVTATGWANGISAVDIASATVVVGIPIVPPLIYITKVPEPLVLAREGGMVTYTNTVTNPGIVSLSNIRVWDDQCGPVNYVSGDANHNSMLDIDEAWAYTCRTNLAQTTTNTVIAEGIANGFIARDFAIATVVVGIPGLPNSGFNGGRIPWNMILPGVIVAAFLLFLIRRNKLLM